MEEGGIQVGGQEEGRVGEVEGGIEVGVQEEGQVGEEEMRGGRGSSVGRGRGR